MAKSVASSSLVKTAFYGEGKHMSVTKIIWLTPQTRTGGGSSAPCKSCCPVKSTLLTRCSGYTPLPEGTISPTAVSVSFVPPPTAPNTTPLRLLTNGEPEPEIDEARASEILKEEDLEVLVDLGGGSEEATVWTCDFSHVGPVRMACCAPWLMMPGLRDYQRRRESIGQLCRGALTSQYRS